jgi:palmitoyltransferase
MPAHESRTTTRQHKCIGFSEALEQQREKREARGGQPWLVRKLTVGIVVAIVGYAVYVYVDRFCVPMIRKEARAIGDRTMGSE